MKSFTSVFVILLCMVFSIRAQNNVGINDNNSNPNASAMLDVYSTSKGLLIPRIALTSSTTAAPVTAPVTSLLIYNTATTGDVIPGFYYWNGSKWIGLSSDGFLTAPYASYIDTTDQVTASTTTAYPVKYNINDAQYGFTHTAGTSAITADYTGKYLITFSGVFQSSAPNKIFNVWLRVNGVDYAMSNTNFQLLGTAQNRIVTVTYIVPLAAGQNIELVMQSNDTGGKLDFTTHQHSPDRPVCPSIILTVNKISN
jgi:hypothetical protein